MTYVCKIDKPQTSEVKNNLFYRAGVPILTELRRHGFVWWVLSRFRRLPVPSRPTEVNSTNLVVQANPAVLEQFARELYGIELNGHEVEITIVPAQPQGERCKPQLV